MRYRRRTREVGDDPHALHLPLTAPRRSDELSVSAATVRNMAGDPKREWWSRKAPQVYARVAGRDADSPPIRLPDGANDKPAPFDSEGRTYRQLTKARLLLCPMKECEPFWKVRQGVNLRSHFCHEERPNDAVHRGGPESVWHQQAKFAIHDWLAATVDPADVADLQLEYEHLPALRDGRRRCPDVYLELKNGPRVAFECQQQTMAGTDPKDHRAIWQNRMADYRELRASLGLRVVWLVSPWATTGNPKFERDNVWRVEVFGGYAAQMLEAGETVYWIDPAFGQIGTLTEHIPRPHDFDLPRGYLKHAKEFPKRGKWYWLHSDNIIDCDINPRTGIVTTPTDVRVQADQGIADRHVELEAEKVAAAKQKQAAREERINQEARQRAARDEENMRERQDAARRRCEKREADAEFYRKIKAEANREAKRKEFVRLAISAGAFLAAAILIAVLAVVAARWGL